MLTVTGELPNKLKVAGGQQLAQLAPGAECACLCIPHDTQQLSRFEVLVPELIKLKVEQVTGLEEAAGLRLLRFRTGEELGNTEAGAPIVNDQGEVVAVYSHNDEGKHFAPLSDISSTWGRAPEIWVAPKLPPPPPPGEEQK